MSLKNYKKKIINVLINFLILHTHKRYKITNLEVNNALFKEFDKVLSKQKIVLTLRDHFFQPDAQDDEVPEFFNLTLPQLYSDPPKFEALTTLFRDKGKNSIFIGLKEIKEFGKQDSTTMECPVFSFNETLYEPCPMFDEENTTHDHEKQLTILNDASSYKQIVQLKDLILGKRYELTSLEILENRYMGGLTQIKQVSKRKINFPLALSLSLFNFRLQ